MRAAKLPALIFTLAVTALLGQVSLAASACTVLGVQDATALLGTALPENYEAELPASDENGQDQTSVCGWFPEGYELASADAPPEYGIQVEIHGFPTAAAAKAFHRAAETEALEVLKASGAGGKISAIVGVGETAFADEKQIAAVNIATLRYLKGIHAVQLQVWRKTGSAEEIAIRAARQTAAKL